MGEIPGYTYGGADVARSPLSLDELRLLEQTLGFSAEDRAHLRLAAPILTEQVDNYLDDWHTHLATLPHLDIFRADPEGQPLPAYRAASRKRFRQWVLDTCQRDFDQDWLNYQYEIGLRHAPAKKNQTDGVRSAPFVSLRYILALAYPFAAAAGPFLAKSDHPAATILKMQQAWSKAVLLQIILWSQPYIRDGEF